MGLKVALKETFYAVKCDQMQQSKQCFLNVSLWAVKELIRKKNDIFGPFLRSRAGYFLCINIRILRLLCKFFLLFGGISYKLKSHSVSIRPNDLSIVGISYHRIEDVFFFLSRGRVYSNFMTICVQTSALASAWWRRVKSYLLTVATDWCKRRFGISLIYLPLTKCR